jgi:hypothetical protein
LKLDDDILTEVLVDFLECTLFNRIVQVRGLDRLREALGNDVPGQNDDVVLEVGNKLGLVDVESRHLHLHTIILDVNLSQVDFFKLVLAVEPEL